MIIHLENNQMLDSYLHPNQLTVVKFSTSTCPPCNMLKPIFETLSVSPENKDVTFISVNAKEHPLARDYKINSVPTICYFVDHTLVLQEIGLHPKAYFDELLSRLKANNL